VNHFRKINAFFAYTIYLSSLSVVGFGFLKLAKPRVEQQPRNLHLFFTAVSAVSVSSMSVVEMEDFSGAQLLIIAALMFGGGEVFTSTVRVFFENLRTKKKHASETRVSSSITPTDSANTPHDEVRTDVPESDSEETVIRNGSTRFLALVLVGYLSVIHFVGIACVLIYLTAVPSSGRVLRKKGIGNFTFSIFVVVSTFANCGFVPTNEGMTVFSGDSGLLLILIPQIVLGNTLFPAFLRVSVWTVGKKMKKTESEYLLNRAPPSLYSHLLPRIQALFLAGTALLFAAIGFALFSSLEWDSAALFGLSPYQKVVAVVFQCINARHSGENVVPLGDLAPAILVFFIAMMYLPPYTSYMPLKKIIGGEEKRHTLLENLIFSQLTYLTIFIIIICITERASLVDDPINFSVLNIVFEVISAYGNVGFSIGYSCELRIRPDPTCVDKWYGFCGKWSDEGKIVLIFVMMFGRMKQFNMHGGQAWVLI
ncbi:hypothetical protein M569_05541, partial [Genlisea aurea]